MPGETDPTLDALLDELRAVTAALNDAHHPVYQADPRRIAELDRRVGTLRVEISARRRELAGA